MSNHVTVFIKLTSAITVGGEVVKPPAIVEVTNAEARNLLHRGKGVLATEHDAPPDARSLGAEAELNPEIAAANDATSKPEGADLPLVDFTPQDAPQDAEPEQPTDNADAPQSAPQVSRRRRS